MKGKKILFFIALCLIIPEVKASSCSVKASATSITVGKSVTITITGSDAIGRFNISSSGGSLSNSSVWIENGSQSVSFKSSKEGTYTVYASPQSGLSNNNGDEINISCNSVKITVKSTSTSSSSNTTTTKTPTKSSNNDLKSFGIEGYEISPEFSKGTTEYTVTVPYDTKEIQINAYKDDDKASISGDDGVKEVNTGENKFTTVITAENGSKKSYSITVYVEEEPIKIKVDNKEYNLVTKEEDLPELKTEHEVISLNIQDREVKAYRIDSISYVLVGLKDENGLVTLYKYDSYKDEEKEDKYTIYQELNSESINLVIKDAPNIPFGYTKEIIKINEKEVTAYKKEEGFYLVYGMNVENGKESFYTYDKEEKTFQRYLETDVISTDLLKLIFIAIALVLSILLGIITALSIKVSQYKPKKEKKEKIKKEKKEKVKKEKPKKEKKNKKIKVTKVEDKKAIELEIPKEEK